MEGGLATCTDVSWHRNTSEELLNCSTASCHSSRQPRAAAQPSQAKHPSHPPAGMSCRALNSAVVLAPGGASLAGGASKRSKRATLGRHSLLMREA